MMTNKICKEYCYVLLESKNILHLQVWPVNGLLNSNVLKIRPLFLSPPGSLAENQQASLLQFTFKFCHSTCLIMLVMQHQGLGFKIICILSFHFDHPLSQLLSSFLLQTKLNAGLFMCNPGDRGCVGSHFVQKAGGSCTRCMRKNMLPQIYVGFYKSDWKDCRRMNPVWCLHRFLHLNIHTVFIHLAPGLLLCGSAQCVSEHVWYRDRFLVGYRENMSMVARSAWGTIRSHESRCYAVGSRRRAKSQTGSQLCSTM